MSFLKQLTILVCLMLLAGGAYLGWQTLFAESAQSADSAGKSTRARKPPTVETARASVRAVETLAEAVGSTRARRAVEITPLAAGRVTEIAFRAGQVVAAGDVLLRLDDDIQRADVIEAQAKLDEARTALSRARSLKRTSAVSEESVERLTTAVATASADLERANRRLRDRTVRAPFGGVVGFSQVELGARVEDGDTVTTLDDLSPIEVEFSLPERLFGQVGPGQRVIARAAAFGERDFDGTIETLDSRIDPVGRSFKARAVIANPDRALPAGMFMHISVVLAAREVLSVPEAALIVEGQDTYLFAVVSGERGQRAQRRDVRLGQRGFGFVEIADGLQAGEDVIIRGLQRVRDGGPVAPAGRAAGETAGRKAAADDGMGGKRAADQGADTSSGGSAEGATGAPGGAKRS